MDRPTIIAFTKGFLLTISRYKVVQVGDKTDEHNDNTGLYLYDHSGTFTVASDDLDNDMF